MKLELSGASESKNVENISKTTSSSKSKKTDSTPWAFENTLDLSMTFYTNGAMRIQIDDETQYRYRVGEMEEDRVIDNSGTNLKRVNNIFNNIRNENNHLSVSIVDEEFGQKHVYLISLNKLWISLEVDGEPTVTINPQFTDDQAA